MIGVFLLENFQEALTGEHVDSASARVVEQVVRTTCNFTGRDFLPSFRVEDKQSRRPPASHEEPVMSFVERHREIVFGGSNGPTGQDGALDSINDFDLLLVRNVHEKTSSRFLKAKRFRMGVDDDVPNLLPVGIQKPKPSRALLSFPQLFRPGVSDDHTLAAGVVANVVGVIGELHSRKDLKCGPIEDLRDAVKAAGDEQPVGGGVVKHSLWLSQIGNRAHALARFQVDHLERMVVHSGHEEALAFHVDAGMIDAAFDVRQGNMGFQRQGLGLLAGGRAARNEQCCKNQ